MVRSGILGGSGHSNIRSEFGSGVFGHLKRQRARTSSGKVLGHGTGWSHPNSHIGFRHSTSVSSKIGHGAGMDTSNRSEVLCH
jgi:hypothetical protein